MSTSPAIRPVAIVGHAAIMPEAPNGDAFWANITGGRYCVTEVPPERWDPALYFDPDHSVPDKTYTTIGGWVRDFAWDPIAWRLPIPPTVANQMDEGQRWALSAARSALTMAGWPAWGVDSDRVAVILGNAIGGEKHYNSSMRIKLPEVIRQLEASPTLGGLPPDVQRAVVEETRAGYLSATLPITEDTMPGELSNVMAGRIANLFNLRGPNFTTDAACASGLAALDAAARGLVDHQYDAVVTGGVDRNMGVDAFVKFCKIGALSATGTRPFDAGADGFVMGEGAALFVLKRLEDAERDGDHVYAVILGIGGSSDGKGKSITAPNPVGQQLAVRRAWANSGQDPATVMAVEAHGTSTRVGDAAELTSLQEVFGPAGVAPRSVALGSVKSNIGHLKAAAGTAGLYKMVRSLDEKVLAPSLGFVHPNENVDWDTSPFAVNTALRAWPDPPTGVRRGAVSAFGFGGTNFHVVLEEYVPGRYQGQSRAFAAAVPAASSAPAHATPAPAAPAKAPLRGALVLGGETDADVLRQVRAALDGAKAGDAPAPAAPHPSAGTAAVRVAVDFADAADLAGKLGKLVTAFDTGNPAVFKMLRQQGVFVGRGPAPKVAFLYTGQGSQYVNMLHDLVASEPVVAETFAEADAVMTPLLGRPLTSFIFSDDAGQDTMDRLGAQLMQTEITQPAVLATDLSLTRLLAAYGIHPDLVMGHSLGEYGALVAAGSLSFGAALEAVSARGREMTKVSMADNGAMAAVFGPLAEIERIVADADGYVVIANINSFNQAVVGGATEAVERIVERFQSAGLNAVRIPVSHAFHTSIVAPASEPLKVALARLDVRGPRLPIVANVTGELYPAGADTATMLDYLGRQVASPVQFVKGLETLYANGARVFVEVGPKKALHGFVEDVLGTRHDDVLALFTNHPKLDDAAAVNQALCGLYAAGLGYAASATPSPAPHPQAAMSSAMPPTAPSSPAPSSPAPHTLDAVASPAASADLAAMTTTSSGPTVADATITELGRLFAGVLAEGMRLMGGEPAATPAAPVAAPAAPTGPDGLATREPVVITGAALGLPGVPQTFDDANIAKILAGQSFIEVLPDEVRARMVDQRITRLVKDAAGGGSFVTIDDPADVIKLAGRHAPLDVVEQFGIDKARDEALDNTTRMALASGFDAMRDAGIPLVMRYKTTTLGTQLPDRWGLPESLRDDTGVIFASAFPGYDRFAEAIEAYALDKGRRDNLLALESVRAAMTDGEPAAAEADRLIAELRETMAAEPYAFDRKFLFRVLSMGHSQFAEIIGARGPNTQVNAACASTTQAISLAEDWIRAGRCSRVVVVSADDATGEHLLPWVTSGFLATGAAATDEHVEDAATPFDRRRHGMIVGVGAAALVVESAEAARARGIQPICELLGAVIANSAFHGTRLDVEHIGGVMETLIREAEGRGVSRHDIAPSTMFVSHETYTPARGGSAAAEINALRRVFGADAGRVVITNTKGFTGHAMGAGIEDVVAVKALETGIVPPVPNYREPDPDLGSLNLSTGGPYPVEYALRLAAGFGSQVAMSLLRRTPMPDGARRSPDQLGYSYRIIDPVAWQGWLDGLSGHAGSVLEVDRRRLRVADVGAPEVPVAPVTQVPVPYAGIAVPVPHAGIAPSWLPAAPPDLPALPPTQPSVVSEPVAAMAPSYSDPTTTPSLVSEPMVAMATSYSDPTTTAPTLVSEPVAARATSDADPTSAVAPAAPGPATGDPVLAAVTTIVAEMTGYPPELLDPDLDLEADLGVDTVKQAEVFAAVREQYHLERDTTLQLRDFPTLGHVAGWVHDKTGIPAPGTDQPPAASEPVAARTTSDADPTSAVAPAAPGPATGDPVLAAVTTIVAEMTGYPPELLDPDLDLEADLGVDTVKQAEVFAAVREQYHLERDTTLQLRDFPTLGHVAGWVHDKTGIPAPGTDQPPAASEPVAARTTSDADPTSAVAPAAPGPATGDPVLAAVTTIVAEMTGYPPELLDPDLDLEADLGVDTVKQAEVFAAVREQYHLERDTTLQLRDFPTLGHVAGWVHDKTGIPAPGTDQPPAASEPVAARATSDADPTSAVAPAAPGPATGDPVLAAVTTIVAEMTGYPPELLDPDLDLEADLGVDTVKQAEVFAAVREQYHLERDTTLQLRDFPTLGHVAGWVHDKTGIPAPGTDQPPAASEPVAARTTSDADPTSAVAPAAPGPATGDPVLAAVTTIVAEMTGYPPELLDPDLDLEADLGVDTVKQAEVFAAVREQYHLERDTTLQLRDFPTLGHVAGWVHDKTGIPAPGTDQPPAASEPVAARTTSDADPTSAVAPAAPGPATGDPVPAAAAPTIETVRGDLTAIDALPRRVPVPALRPALDRCAPTGIDLDGARVIVMRDEGGVGTALVKRLAKAGATPLVLDPGIATDTLLSTVESWLADGPVAGVYWLPALDDEGDLDTMDLATWTEALRRRVKTLYATMRRLWDTDAFLVSATRLGGRHGYDVMGATAPMGGAVTGFTKSYKKERPGALVKAVDLPASRRTATVADVLIEETLADPGTVEVGRVDGLRWGVVLAEQPFPPLNGDGTPDHDGGLPLTDRSVVLVTGAAGSIVSAITADLATAGAGTFHLLDLTPAPDPADPDLAAFAADKDGLKAALAARMRERGEKATPVAIEKELAGIERLASARAAIAAVESAGGTAHYHSVDLTDPAAVAAVMDSVRATSGRIDVLVHAAGLEISRNLPEKQPAEFDLVFDVKTTGWFNVWRAVEGLDIGATVVFSSVAGRFGNNGQTDYSAANDLLCKITSALRRTRPQTRALALDWTAWGGIGMATRGSIPKIMEMAGVQMLPAEAGVAWIRRELASGAHRGEVVVAGRLGLMAAEYAEHGGADVGRLAGDLTDHGPMVGDVVTSAHHGLVVATTLDPTRQPFLDHHRIDGIPVLPGVMGMEAFAEAATLLAPSGFGVGAVEDVAFLAPVKFYRDEPRTLTVTARVEQDPDGSSQDLLARCALTAERVLPGHDAPQVTTHFTGTVRLTRSAPVEESVPPLGEPPEGRTLTPEDVYALYFHGPAYQVVGAAWRSDGASVARFAADLPDDHVPPSAPLVGAPRLVELCFQAAGLWEAGREGRMALPYAVGSVRVLGSPGPGEHLAVARQVGAGRFDALVVDSDGRVVVRLDGYRSIPLPSPVSSEVVAPLAEAFGAAAVDTH